ncbi:MAG: NUDIX domain-containing protein [Candidatus Thorarchaeota archaeon]|nr:NUDIX domain-containing protein [Candidatus Thorarchaeota archaeon]
MVERKYPSFPIPGVGAIVVGKRGILLVRRDKDPGKGLWSIPGGVPDPGFPFRPVP